MTTISATMVKELREKTGVGMMDCKEALTHSDGDMQKAVEYLRIKGLATAAKRAGRTLSEGIIQTYVHTGAKLGVMVEINCETDFVAKSDDFSQFSKNIAMQIAASNPVSINEDGVPKELIEKEMEIYREQVRAMKKPENMVDKIAQGKLSKFYKENCLMNQMYVKDPNITIQDLLNELIARIGENITIKRFVRFQIGE
ncbi:MAG TPA: translation elongation factor Ts [Desulfatirhabdiaceae bacterium]|nr:translation elongation factor Ts [Desulfatirhabdiaceae bacterium]